MKRIGSTRQAADQFGFHHDDGRVNCYAFLQVSKVPGFPAPIREVRHHKWWDFKAIENWFDKKSGIKPVSTDWKEKLTKGLAGGEGARGIL